MEVGRGLVLKNGQKSQGLDVLDLQRQAQEIKAIIAAKLCSINIDFHVWIYMHPQIFSTFLYLSFFNKCKKK